MNQSNPQSPGAKMFWFTGQPGAGKTVLAHELKKALDNHSLYTLRKHVIIDGDDIRALYNNTDYSIEGRYANVEFVQKLCLFLMKNDIVPIVCMVSPFAAQRNKFCVENNGVEIYVHCTEERGREAYHVEYYEKPIIDDVTAFSVDTTGLITNQSFTNLYYGKLFSKIN